MTVVVSGLPRSGTSMMMRMLMEGGIPVLVDCSRPPDKHNPGGYFEYAPASRLHLDCSWFHQAEGRAIKVIYRFLRHLPAGHDYRVLFMRRHIREIVVSQNDMLAQTAPAGTAVCLPRSVREWEEALTREVDATIRWVARQSNLRLLEVDFNKLIMSPHTSVDAIADFLGIPVDRNKMGAVIDPRLYRHRFPLSGDGSNSTPGKTNGLPSI